MITEPKPSEEAMLRAQIVWIRERSWKLCVSAIYAIDVPPLLAAIAAKDVEIERLTKERDEAFGDARVNAGAYRYESKSHVHSVERLMRQNAAKDVEIERLTKERDEARKRSQEIWDERAQILRDAGFDQFALLKRADIARAAEEELAAALQKIGMALGSSDEWTDRGTMIADVLERFAASRAEIARLTKECDVLRERLAKAETASRDISEGWIMAATFFESSLAEKDAEIERLTEERDEAWSAFSKKLDGYVFTAETMVSIAKQRNAAVSSLSAVRALLPVDAESGRNEDMREKVTAAIEDFFGCSRVAASMARDHILVAMRAAVPSAPGVEALVEALEFYVDPYEWLVTHGEEPLCPDFYDELSFGDRARVALETFLANRSGEP